MTGHGPFPTRYETNRLVLERIHRDTVEAITLYEHCKQNATAGAYEYVPQSAFNTVKDAYDALENLESRWENGDGAQYAVFPSVENGVTELADRPLYGIADVQCEWDRRSAHPGVILARAQWGQGYGSECLEVLFTLAFDRLALEVVTLHHHVDNEQSKQMIEKLIDRYGGQYDCLLRNWTPMDDGVADEHRYTITREQYRDAAAE